MTAWIEFRVIIDRAVTHVVGFLASLHYPLPRVKGPTLVVRSTSLGDLTVMLPFLASVLQRDTETHLLLFSRVGNVGSAILPHWTDRIAVVDPSTTDSLVSTMRSARAQLASTRFSRILFATQNSDSPRGKLKRLLVLRAIAGFRAPLYGLSGCSVLRSRRDLERTNGAIALNQSLAPFMACGVARKATREDCNRLLAITTAEREQSTQILVARGLRLSAPGLALYVHGKDQRKRWPLDRYVALARSLIDESDRTLLLIGGPEDVQASLAVAASLPRDRVAVLAGRLSVRATLAVLAQCDLFVGNDGAPAHFAALKGCRCVTVFCNWEVPGIWEPLAAPASTSLRPDWHLGRRGDDFGIDHVPLTGVLAAVKKHLRPNSRSVSHQIQTFSLDGTFTRSTIVDGPLASLRSHASQ